MRSRLNTEVTTAIYIKYANVILIRITNIFSI